MPISTQLQAQIDAIQTRIDTLAPSATPEDIVMLAKAVEAVGGQATVFDVIDTGQQQKAELITTADLKSAEVVATGDAQVDRVSQQGDLKFSELSQEVQRYAAFGGATPSAMGSLGMVPAPQAGEDRRFLRGDGAWRFPGEIPIGSIALIHPNMDTSRYLPAEGGTVLIADYPELAEVLGQSPNNLPTPSVGNTVLSGESPGYGSNRAAAVNGERAVIVRSGSSGIQYSNNGGQNWANTQIGALGFQGPYWPAISDSGRTVGWVNYDSTPSPAVVRCQFTTAATFGAWTGFVNGGGDQFEVTWASIVVGLPQGVAFIDKKSAAAQILFKYVQDGATAITREVNLTVTLDTRITQARGALRVGSSLYLLVDNGSSWNALYRTTDAGATWSKAWEGANNWGDHALLLRSNGSFNRQDTSQPSYVENGIGILHYGNQLLLIAEDGTLTWVNQPSGHTLIAGSIHFVAGFYYAASGNAVFRTADFSSWEQVATASQILGATGTLARMWVHPSTGCFGFYSGLNTLTLVQTRDFVSFKRNSRPSRWSTSIVLRRFNFTGDRFVWLIAESSNNSYYFDFALFDLVSGRLYANNYFSNYGASIYGYWLLPLSGGRWLHFTQQSSSYYVNVASSASLYSYNLATEFRLPTSTGEFGAVGAYGNQTGWLFSTDSSSRGGYRYYVRAQ